MKKKNVLKKKLGFVVDWSRPIARLQFTYEKLGEVGNHRYEINDVRLRVSGDGNTIFSGVLSKHRDNARIGGIGHFRRDQPIKIEAVEYA